MSIDPPHFRTPSQKDLNFVLNSWLKSNRNEHQHVTNEVYYTFYKKIIAELLSKADTVIACDPADHNSIWGYIVYEPSTVHYIYVKHALRRFGIANSLMSLMPEFNVLQSTHSSVHARKYHKKYPELVTYNPYLLPRVK